MNAYHGNPELKASLVRMARLHEAEDRYIRGEFYRNSTEEWKGCSQGCTVKSLYLMGYIGEFGQIKNMNFGDHAALANALGLPVFLTRMADRLFESLPNGEHIAWTGDLYEAVQVGKDLSAMQHDFLNWMLNHPRWGTAQYTSDSRALRVAEMYASGVPYTKDEWWQARSDARAAAADAAADAATYAAAAAYAARGQYWQDVRAWILAYVAVPEMVIA